MKVEIKKIHSWEIPSIQHAIKLQRELAERVIVAGEPDFVRFIAAGDLAFSKDGRAFAAVVLLEYPSLDVVDIVKGFEKVRMPYIPGLLSFRESPLLLKLFEKLSVTPDLVMLDGQGIAHPRGLGLAAHIGLFLGIPTVGCAKSKLVGTYDEPGYERGSWSWLYHNGKKIGVVLRTRTGKNPIFVSPGHLLSFDAAREWALRTTTRYRIPEPTRQAHIAVSKFKKEILK